MVKTAVIGIVSGLVNGLLGSGGGTVIVPSLEYFDKMEEHKAHATAVAVILPLSFISGLIYLYKGKIIMQSVLAVGAGSIIGSIIGALLLNKISSGFLRKLFGIVMIISAARMFF